MHTTLLCTLYGFSVRETAMFIILHLLQLIYAYVCSYIENISPLLKKVQNIQILSVDVIYMYMYLMEPIHVHMAHLNVYSSSLCHHQHFSLSSLQERKDKPQPRSRQEPPAIWLVKLGSVVTFVSLQASRCSEFIFPKIQHYVRQN